MIAPGLRLPHPRNPREKSGAFDHAAAPPGSNSPCFLVTRLAAAAAVGRLGLGGMDSQAAVHSQKPPQPKQG
jgi:hypothetical protein